MQKVDEAVHAARKNREWRHEYMTLYMRDQENLKKGRERGVAAIVLNVLKTTKSISQTARLVQMDEEEVRKIAAERQLNFEE